MPFRVRERGGYLTSGYNVTFATHTHVHRVHAPWHSTTAGHTVSSIINLFVDKTLPFTLHLYQQHKFVHLYPGNWRML
jgi:hypothetical protein